MLGNEFALNCRLQVVATTSRAYKGTAYRTHSWRRSFRDGDKVKHQTWGNLSHLSPVLMKTIRRRLAGDDAEPSGSWEVVRSLPHGDVVAVLGSLPGIGMAVVLGSRLYAGRDLAMTLIVTRLLAAVRAVADTPHEPRRWPATSRFLIVADSTAVTRDFVVVDLACVDG